MSGNAFAAACDVVPPARSGVAAGVLNMTGGFTGAAMVLVAGYAKSTIGFGALMTWSAALTGVAGCVLMLGAAAWYQKEQRRREQT